MTTLRARQSSKSQQASYVGYRMTRAEGGRYQAPTWAKPRQRPLSWNCVKQIVDYREDNYFFCDLYDNQQKAVDQMVTKYQKRGKSKGMEWTIFYIEKLWKTVIDRDGECRRECYAIHIVLEGVARPELPLRSGGHHYQQINIFGGRVQLGDSYTTPLGYELAKSITNSNTLQECNESGQGVLQDL